MLDSVRISGHVSVAVRHEDGTTSVVEQPNMIVTTGLERLAALFAQDSTAFASHIAIGTGTTAVTAGDTALETEVDRNALGSDTASGAVATFKAFFSKSEANGSTISEVGLFDQASTGTLIARSVLASTVAKDATKSLTITWTFTLADA